ncbi:MAG: glycosyltransferase family A protein [Patescibacteria group bacterium]|jgi:glycosyltransferase involved in cell wall biosynthesis
MPVISVVIPLYNQASELDTVLKSLIGQSFRDFEVIVVDDASKDNPDEAFLIWKDKFNRAEIGFLLIKHERNLGAPAARNAGFRASTGKYLFFCDADARLEKDALEIFIETLLKNPGAAFAYSSFKFGRKIFRLFPFSEEKLKEMPYIHTMSLIRREDFPGFDESLKKFQDWDLWLNITGKGRIGIFIDRVLFRVKPGGTMSSWLPSFAYKLMPFLPAVKRYNRALKIIKKKYGLGKSR